MEEHIIKILNQYEEDDLITAGELRRIISLSLKKRDEENIKATLKIQQELP